MTAILVVVSVVVALAIVASASNSVQAAADGPTCPVCGSRASVAMAAGSHRCVGCGSLFRQGEEWVGNAKCRHCGAQATRLVADSYESGLYEVSFRCGRVVRYDSFKGVKNDSGCPSLDTPEPEYYGDETVVDMG